MINILLVEDNQEKIKNIVRVVEPFLGEEIVLNRANDINRAKEILRHKNIDIMILDIYLPQIYGDEVLQDGGITLLKTLKKSKTYSYPRYVISVSGYENSTKVFEASEGNIHKAIYYDPTSNQWEVTLQQCLETAIAIISNTVWHRLYDYDIAVVCALEEEINVIKESLTDVKVVKVDYDDDIYYAGFFMKDDKKIRVIISRANQMGMVATTSLTTKIIYNFAPKYMVMTGITGGTKPDKLNFGDVIVAERSWDYRAGKDIREKHKAKHLNTINAIEIDTSLINYCRCLAEDTETLNSIKESFGGENKPEENLRLLLGPVVSGASVVTDPQIVKDVLDHQHREVLGIEMEIYGMYYASSWALKPRPKVIAMKGVSDFADSDKGDKYHDYASYTSAKVFEVLAKNYFEYDSF